MLLNVQLDVIFSDGDANVHGKCNCFKWMNLKQKEIYENHPTEKDAVSNSFEHFIIVFNSRCLVERGETAI